MSRYVVGVDIGGTFSDLVCLDKKTGELSNVKVPSTPPTFIEGIMNGLQRAGALEDLALFKHGSTIATNAVIQRRGAPTGLITTRGFRDVLQAARGDRPDLYNFHWDPGEPLVPRRNRLGVTERIDYEGNVVEPLNEAEVREVCRLFKKRGIEAVAIAFINSFMNPAHERRAKEIVLEEMPGAYVSTSYEVNPEIKEFERTSTVVVNAYLGPVVKNYYAQLTERMRQGGYGGEILVIHSGGGMMSVDAAQELPARTCQSGPAGGVMGGSLVGRLAGFENVITIDIGGTSADIALVNRGEPLVESETKVEWKIPIRFPCVDLVAIGAGGGSIAWIDSGGTLKSGPQSAGANPGPACYDMGGTDPTNTDANVVLGRLAPSAFLGGEMTLKPALAAEAIEGRIARHFGMSLEEAADGILRVSTANMVNAIRLVSVERGYDPRDFALVAFGGGGPLFGADLARELNIPKVVVPRWPGLTSALGVLLVDVRHDFIQPVLQKENDIDPAALTGVFEDLEAEALQTLQSEGVPEDQIRLQRVVDVKYFKQTRYLQVPVTSGRLDRGVIEDIVRQFNERHQQEFGYTVPSSYAAVEIGNARVTALGTAGRYELKRYPEKGTAQEAAKDARPVYFREAGGFVETRVYDRSRLKNGAVIEGPAIVEQVDSTTVIPPGAKATVDEYLNMVLDLTPLLGK